MHKKRHSREIVFLKPVFEQIYSFRQKKSEPFLEILIAQPENVSQKNLGNLFGIFEVNDFTEDSSYIVNYLISVIKKEYFSKPKRGAVESLEAALHKANLSLSKIAKHGNVSWMGKIDAVCAVIEKNNLHFSKTGEGVLLMLRSKSLAEISDGMHENNNNPLKTFTDISSGKLQSDDKLLITTSEIFELFSKEELKKSALRFSQKAFSRFLNTALCNELEKTATLIVDIQEEKKEIAKKQKNKKKINAFSQASFNKKTTTLSKEERDKKTNLDQELEKIKKEKGGFVDEKTGHIYIKEGLEDQKDDKDFSFEKSLKTLREKLELLFKTKKPIDFEQTESLETISFKEKTKETIKKSSRYLKSLLINSARKLKNIPIKEKLLALIKSLKLSEKSSKTLGIEEDVTKNTNVLPSSSVKQKINNFFHSFVPSFSKIKNFNRLSLKQKIIAGLILVIIFIVPLILVKVENQTEQSETKESVPPQEETSLPLENESNVTRIENLEGYDIENNNLKKILSLGENNYIISENKIQRLNDQQTWNIPSEFFPISDAASMELLNLIFLIGKDSQIISFSPIDQSFSQNQIDLAENNQIEDIKTYTTYLYILDSQNNQIYRYPRAEGGFGERIEWLKEEIDIDSGANMSIDENIFLANNSQIYKLFQGKEESFSPEGSSLSISPSRMIIKDGFIYLLDKENSRIIKSDLEGKISQQFYNKELKKVQDFSLNQNKVFLISETELNSFDLP